MSKKQTKHATTADKISANISRTTDLATRTTGDYPIPIKNGAAQELKLSLGVDNFRTVAMTYARRQLNEARAKAETARNTAAEALKDAARELSHLGDQLYAQLTVPLKLQAVVAAIAAWTSSQAFTAIAVKPYCGRNEENEQPVLDVDKHVMPIEWRVRNTKKFCSGYDDIDALKQPQAIPFTPEMIAIADRILVLQHDEAAAVEDLRTVNRMYAQLEVRGDEVETAITLAHLQGQINNTSDLYAIIRQTMFDRSTLPERVQKLLAKE